METAGIEQDAAISHAKTFGTGDMAEQAQSTLPSSQPRLTHVRG